MKHLIKKTTLSQETANLLRDRIIIGFYSQGEKIVEENLASEFEVSRATVREALRFLEAEGVIVREINRYSCVRELSAKDIRDLFAMRCFLEREAVKHCIANNCIPEQDLRTYIEDIHRSVNQGREAWDSYLQADIGFHDTIIRALDNPYAWKAWKMMKSQYLMAIYMFRAFAPGSFWGKSEQHAEMLDALLVGDSGPWFRHLETLAVDVAAFAAHIENKKSH